MSLGGGGPPCPPSAAALDRRELVFLGLIAILLVFLKGS